MIQRLERFQRRWLKAAMEDPAIDTACLSMPRGNGKSALAGHVLARCLTPGDPWHVPGVEFLLVAASLSQARKQSFMFTKRALGLPGRPGWSVAESDQRCSIRHVRSGTRLQVLARGGNTAMGIVGCPLMVCDEPGAWETNVGERMFEAVSTAQGKPGSRMRVLWVGTLAPAESGWWHDMILAGSEGSRHVTLLQGRRSSWSDWREIARVNPLSRIAPAFRRRLLAERDEARRDERSKARFLSYRLNLPARDDTEVLLTVEEWDAALARPVAERAGPLLVGIDLGSTRSWSAAVACWPASRRVEAFAIAPGIPDLDAQEVRDHAPRSSYGKLHTAGALLVAEGLHVVPPARLVEEVQRRWGVPAVAACDRFRTGELLDGGGLGWPAVDARVARWSEASADVRAARRLTKDGGLTVEPISRGLLTWSMSRAQVADDGSGNQRIVKRGPGKTRSRDDAAAAFVLACGLADRWTPPGPLTIY